MKTKEHNYTKREGDDIAILIKRIQRKLYERDKVIYPKNRVYDMAVVMMANSFPNHITIK
jgi:hypothetical protein